MLRSRIFIVLILVVLGFYAAWLYLQLAAPACLVACGGIYQGVISGTAMSPYRYRVLSFALIDILGGNPQTEGAIATAYVIAHGIVFPLTFVAYYAALRRWLEPLGALLGIVLLVLYLPVMFRVYGTSLYLPIELGLLSLALYWMRPGWRYALLVILATLNRETGILLVLAFAAVMLPRWRERRVQAWMLIYAALWLSIYVGLRRWLGIAPEEVGLDGAWIGNTQTWHLTDAITNNLFFVPLFVAVFLAWRHLSKEIRRLLIGVGLPYLGLVFLFGFWNETRLWMPMMPLLTVALSTAIEYQVLPQSDNTIST